MSTQEPTGSNLSNNSGVPHAMGELRDLEPVAKALNEESDALRGILATLNRKLGAFNIGLQTWMSDRHSSGYDYEFFCGDVWPSVGTTYTDSRPSDGHTFAWELGYIKFGDEWSIAVRPVWISIVTNEDYRGEDHIVEAGSPRSILDAPRSVRIASAGRLSDLIDHIKATAEEGVEAIRQAKKLSETL